MKIENQPWHVSIIAAASGFIEINDSRGQRVAALYLADYPYTTGEIFTVANQLCAAPAMLAALKLMRTILDNPLEYTDIGRERAMKQVEAAIRFAEGVTVKT